MTGLLLSTCDIRLDSRQRAGLADCKAPGQASGPSCQNWHEEAKMRTSDSEVSCTGRMQMRISDSVVSAPLSQDPSRATCTNLQRGAPLEECDYDGQQQIGRMNNSQTTEREEPCRLCRVNAAGRQGDAHEGAEQCCRGDMVGAGDAVTVAGEATSWVSSFRQPHTLCQKKGSLWSGLPEVFTSLWPGHSKWARDGTDGCWASLYGAPGDPWGLLPHPETRRQIGVRWPQSPCFVHVWQRKAQA